MAYYDEVIAKPAKKKEGLAVDFWFARIADFDAIAPLTPVADDNDSQVTITTAHTFLTDKGFIKATAYIYEGQLTTTPGGAPGAETNPSQVVYFMPETKALKALIDEAPDLMLMVKDADCGVSEFKQIGDSCAPTKIIGAFDSSKQNEGGRKGWNVTFDSADTFYYYDAVLTEIA